MKQCETANENNISPSKNYRPDWITDDLINDTKSVWQKYYTNPLREEEVIEMINSVGRLADIDNQSKPCSIF